MTSRPGWAGTTNTYVYIFNVGRGLSVFLRLPNNIGLMYDLGSSEEFSPSDFVEQKCLPFLNRYQAPDCPSAGIAQTIVSHPHSDHILEIDKTHQGKPLSPGLLTCPNHKIASEAFDFSRLQNPPGKEALKADYIRAYERRGRGLQTLDLSSGSLLYGLEYGIFYVRPPECDKLHPSSDQDYANASSVVLYLKHGPHSILLPGDITPSALDLILADDRCSVAKRYSSFKHGVGARTAGGVECPALGTLLKNYGLGILLAPHHGLESGFSETLGYYIRGGKPLLNVISEKRQTGANDGCVHAAYQSADGAAGLFVDIEGNPEKRYSVTTRNGHHVLVVFKASSSLPSVFLRRNPEDLLSIVV